MTSCLEKLLLKATKKSSLNPEASIGGQGLQMLASHVPLVSEHTHGMAGRSTDAPQPTAHQEAQETAPACITGRRPPVLAQASGGPTDPSSCSLSRARGYTVRKTQEEGRLGPTLQELARGPTPAQRERREEEQVGEATRDGSPLGWRPPELQPHE